MGNCRYCPLSRMGLAMNKLIRSVLGIALATTAVLPFAGPAAAVETPAPGCPTQDPGYEAGGVCQVTVTTVDPTCVGGVASLDYVVTAEGTPSSTVTITFVNPSGGNVVYANQPLTGSVLWPGMVVTGGQATDWPGWTKAADGTWSSGDEFSWADSNVQVLFAVGPEAAATVTYPQGTGSGYCGPSSSEVLAAPPNASTSLVSNVLAATGANPMPLAFLGGGLILVGGSLLVMRSRLRHRSHS